MAIKKPVSKSTGAPSVKPVKPRAPVFTAANFGIATINELAQGKSITSAVGSGLFYTAWEAISPATMYGSVIASGVRSVGNAINQSAKNVANDMENGRYSPNPTFMNNTGFNPANQQAATMRQSAVMAIQGSKMNARNALGNEASLMHRGYR